MVDNLCVLNIIQTKNLYNSSDFHKSPALLKADFILF